MEKRQEDQIRTESGKIRCSRSYFETKIKKMPEDYYYNQKMGARDEVKTNYTKNNSDHEIRFTQQENSEILKSGKKRGFSINKMKIKVDNQEKFKEFLKDSPSHDRKAKSLQPIKK